MRHRANAIAAILTIGLMMVPGRATTTFPRDRVCPVGGETYESFEIGSTSYYGVRLDLQRTGVGAHLPYIECPNGFILFKAEEEYTKDEIAKLTPVVASAAYQAARRNDVPPVRLVMLHKALGDSDVDLRHLYFRAAFESEGGKDDAARLKYLALAAEGYGAFLTTHRTHDDEWWFSSVRRADLLRQMGRFEEAAAAVSELQKAHGTEPPIFLEIAAEILKRANARDPQPAGYEKEPA